MAGVGLQSPSISCMLTRDLQNIRYLSDLTHSTHTMQLNYYST